MKNKKRILSGLLAAALVVPLFAGGAQTAAAAEAAGKTLDVVFTHDTHSHLNSFSTVIDGESTSPLSIHSAGRQSLSAVHRYSFPRK